eukprot:TRINITY_DN287_c0_g1_i4.p1 TRINITY_DN287_c0_g1~~TRINITY_DN287_c0_g1_i4.p1  ORF type:complete len:407 (+),score=43.75 TRINITY_DN287_c0_g1_i4:88-1308(+)
MSKPMREANWKLGSNFRVTCVRTHSTGHKKIRVYESVHGSAHKRIEQETIPDYPIPFTFLETTIKNLSIFLERTNFRVKVESVFLVICDNHNRIIQNCLQTPASKNATDILTAIEIEGVHTIRNINICKTSSKVYGSDVAGLIDHQGGLLHPVLLIETDQGLVESHLPEFWSVSNCPHRPREAERFRMMMNALRSCDPSVPKPCDRIPAPMCGRQKRVGKSFTRGKFVLDMTEYLEDRSAFYRASEMKDFEFPQGVGLRSENRLKFMEAIEYYKKHGYIQARAKIQHVTDGGCMASGVYVVIGAAGQTECSYTTSAHVTGAGINNTSDSDDSLSQQHSHLVVMTEVLNGSGDSEFPHSNQRFTVSPQNYLLPEGFSQSPFYPCLNSFEDSQDCFTLDPSNTPHQFQ